MSRRIRFFRWASTFSALLLASAAAQAAYIGGNVGTITRFYTHATFGNGDVAIMVSAPLGTCQGGFWLRSSDPGFKTIFAQLLSARLAQMPLQIWGFDDQIWSGSGANFCRIDVVDFAD